MASIAITAVLSVMVVLGLPLLGIVLGISGLAYGTLVKLVRVLMLGPVCLVLSLVAPRLALQYGTAGVIVAGEPAQSGSTVPTSCRGSSPASWRWLPAVRSG